MTRTLTNIRPIHADKIPPPHSEPAGITADGKHQLFTLTRKMARNKVEMGLDGEPLYRLNQITGEKLYKKRIPELYDEHLLFYLESEGNGNVRMVQYEKPTPEELERARKAQQAEDIVPALAAALVEKGLTPDTINEWLAEGLSPEEVAEIQEEVAAEPEREVSGEASDEAEDDWQPDPEVEYPEYLPVGRWRLSDGRIIEGKREDAEPLEDEIRLKRAEDKARQTAREHAQAVPEL